MGFLPWTKFDPIFNLKLEQALDAWDPGGQDGYAEGRWTKIRKAKVPPSLLHAGELALDSIAVALVQAEMNPPPLPIALCNPIPENAVRYSLCQRLHRTAGDDSFAQNWACDFCVAPLTPVLAVEAGTVTKLSGRSPFIDSWDTQGVFGWSIHYVTPAGYHYYLTHLGSRTVTKGQKVLAGQIIGAVGDQVFRPDHVHYGVTSPKGAADAKTHILAVAAAPRIPAT